jgi:RNA polymerase sigma-70 factor, ECF subfamily
MRTGTDRSDLVERARRRDPDAWEALYVEVYPRLTAYASRRAGRDHAPDLVAETMARAVAAIERFDASGPGFDAWLFGICRNVVADLHRRTARHDPRKIPAPLPVDDVGERIENDEEAAAMREAYARLSDEDRELLDLRVVAGLSADEVSSVLGKQAGAIRMAQSRALARLRDHFREVYR